MAGEDPKGKGYSRCPICGEPTDMAYRPFCSKRCRDVDLARWLGDGYAIAGGAADADEDGEDAAAAGGRGGASEGDDELP
ncbi:DNA gyrase inhibitor YacG [Hyphomicrobium sp. 1Nfss2.1]|uniref:DNA gyrase inhibitor YacG n=1 Tax=Hyphomicrobium sp. 1Nfss2.1 TaxID=3413936 RepID=UPI003C7DA5AE